MDFASECPSYRRYVEGLPPYLSAFAEPQYYQRYTWENQAVWRYIMRQLSHFLSTHAPATYQRGLEQTAIPIERIPRIEEMNNALKKLGWGALCVNGFIPPAAFMEYNSHRILPISADMRTLQHLLYTPAPDIVHEASGHAPIVVDPRYSDFLQKVGTYGAKALSNHFDQKVYEAIRKLSIVKEHPHSTDEETHAAQEQLNHAVGERAQHPRSEAALISRFHWWTVEYGLFKTKEKHALQVFGAGLLSSLGEGRNCLQDPKVKKVQLSPQCIETDYDITTPQPQLFYVESFEELFSVLETLADKMAFRVGGAEALTKAINCGTLATVVYDSGLQVSGVWAKCLRDPQGHPIYIATQGPTSLAYDGRELEDHSESYHSQGYSSPVGAFHSSHHDHRTRLEFASGVTVEGILGTTVTRKQRPILMSFTECHVKDPQGEVLFQPEWGTYDMAVGESLPSVFGGPADKRNYEFIKQKSDYRSLNIQYTEEEQRVFALYHSVRQLRENQGVNCDLNELQQLYQKIQEQAPNNWLLPLEVVEISEQHQQRHNSTQLQEFHHSAMRDLRTLQNQSSEVSYLIQLGLELAAQ